MATIYEVSKLAGVSLATVSRVMNGNSNVRQKTRDKVEAAIKELNYRPNSMAKSLASNRSDSVGMIVSELHGPFFGSMMSKVETTLRQNGKHVIITAGHSDANSERDAIEFLLNRNCDAIISHVEAISDEELIEITNKTSVPFIFLNRYIPELSDHCIYLNNEMGGYLATQELCRHHCRHIAYIAGPLWKDDATDRLKGHKRALDEAGLTFDERLFFEGDFHEDSGYDGMQALLAKDLPIDALACGNDEMASGAMRAIREAGLAIPGDISIVGFDNIIFTRFMDPRLTTIHFPIDDMGKLAADMIMHDLYGAGDTVDMKHEFDPHLICRESVAKGVKGA